MRIRELRIQKGMTQEELAKAINVSTSSIGMYETGRREPSRESIMLMADIFGVTIDYLLERETATVDMEHQKKINILNNLFNQMTPQQQELLLSLAENLRGA